ncbi:MAG: hypothetical protein AB1746_14035, partial [Candidatus Zixiibacteriota bacterium]
MAGAEFEIKPPFDMRLSLRFATACRFESEADCAEGRFHRMVHISGIPVLLTITTEGSVDKVVGKAIWSFPEGGKVPGRKIVELAQYIVSADLDVAPFYNLASRSNSMKAIIAKFHGLKPILTPSVFESAAWAIMGQQVNLNFAHTLKMRV